MKILLALALIPLALWGLQIIAGTFLTGAAVASEGEGIAPKGCGCLLMIIAVAVVVAIVSNL